MDGAKPQWMLDHEVSDARQFSEINAKLDSLLEIASAFKLGGRGVAWVLGIVFLIGSIIVIIMQLIKGA